jgi:hypothetical protein
VVYAGVSAGQGATFITPAGDPIPPSELVRVIEEAGQRYGLSMTVEWLASAWGTSCFVVKQRWPQGDEKWARVQCGELPADKAFDVIFRFPPEMRTGDMVGLVRDKFGFVRDPRQEADRLMAEAQRLYSQIENGAVDKAVETGTQRILDESDHLRLVRAGAERPHPMVSGADFQESSQPTPTPDREPKRLLGVV